MVSSRTGVGSSILRPAPASSIPRLSNARRISRFSTYPYRHHYDRYRGAFSIGLHFGGYPYHHSGYYHSGYYDPYHHYGHHLYVSYPYYGYYRHYSPYLYSYGYGNCGYYSGYSLRFGYYRSSYYATCSGYGLHGSAYHHRHDYVCDYHGHHYYHVRDCSLCYPAGGSYAYHEVDLPDDYGGEEAPEEGDGEAEGEASTVEEGELSETEEMFFASLRPAQLSFALGMVHFREGQYQRATEAFFNSTIEDPESRMAKVFLANALFAIGEYEHAGSYLRMGLETWDRFPMYRWDLRRLYGKSGDFATHLALLEEHVTLNSQDDDAQLVHGFVLFSSGEYDAAASSLDVVEVHAGDPRVREIAARFTRELEDRLGTFPRDRQVLGETAQDADGRFLSSLRLVDLKELAMR